MPCRSTSLLLLGLTLLLGACVRTPTTARSAAPLDFETDPRILRGVWTGEAEDGHTLLLDANASDPDEGGYTVTGTFQLNDAEPVVFEGYMRAEVTPPAETLSTQTSPASPPFTAASVEGGWRLEGRAPEGSPPRFELLLMHADVAYAFTLTAPTPTALTGTEWRLETLRGKPLVEGSNITLDFGNYSFEGFHGYSGCNYYGARYLATETSFRVVYGVGSTAMLCTAPEGVMAQEGAYHRALGQVVGYRTEGERLEMVDEGGAPVLVFAERTQVPMDPRDLVGTRWQLREVSGDTLAAGTAITLAFPEVGALVAAAGCVAYTGTYEARGNDFQLTMLAANYDVCAEDDVLQGHEAAYSDYLSTTNDYQFLEDELTLFTAPGATLIFEAQP